MPVTHATGVTEDGNSNSSILICVWGSHGLVIRANHICSVQLLKAKVNISYITKLVIICGST